MKQTRYSEEQIVFALRQAETGTPVGEVMRKMGICTQTFYRWKKQYGQVGVDEIRRLKPRRSQRMIHLCSVKVAPMKNSVFSEISLWRGESFL